jgi:hypothetical protein
MVILQCTNEGTGYCSQCSSITRFGRFSRSPLSRTPSSILCLTQAADLPHIFGSGDAFDMAYVRDQLLAHHTTVILLRKEINKGQDSAIRKLAAESISTMLAHVRWHESRWMNCRALSHEHRWYQQVPIDKSQASTRLGRSKACRACPQVETAAASPRLAMIRTTPHVERSRCSAAAALISLSCICPSNICSHVAVRGKFVYCACRKTG